MTVPARRQVASFFRTEFGLSERRACRLIGLHRSTSRYARQRGEDKELRLRLRAWAARRPRWAYRMLHWQIGQDGIMVNRKRVYRLYREEGLRLRRERDRQRLARRSLTMRQKDRIRAAQALAGSAVSSPAAG